MIGSSKIPIDVRLSIPFPIVEKILKDARLKNQQIGQNFNHNIPMKARIILTIEAIAFFTAELLAQAARNLPRDTGPIQWTTGNIIIFIIVPILLIIFLYFYVKQLTRDKLKEREEEKEEENKDKDE